MSAHDEFLALLAGLTVHDGKVPASPAFPYVLVSGTVPRVMDRSLVRSPQGRVARWRTTIAGMSQASVRIISEQVTTRLEGARIAGCRLEAVPNEQPILEDLDVTVNSVHPFYAVLDWRVTLP